MKNGNPNYQILTDLVAEAREGADHPVQDLTFHQIAFIAEAGEWLDQAILRKYYDVERTNGREHNELDELADVLVQLFTLVYALRNHESFPHLLPENTKEIRLASMFMYLIKMLGESSIYVERIEEMAERLVEEVLILYRFDFEDLKYLLENNIAKRSNKED